MRPMPSPRSSPRVIAVAAAAALSACAGVRPPGAPLDPARPVEIRKSWRDTRYLQDGRPVDGLDLAHALQHAPEARRHGDAALRSGAWNVVLLTLGVGVLGASLVAEDEAKPYVEGTALTLLVGSILFQRHADRRLEDAVRAYNAGLAASPAPVRPDAAPTGAAPARPPTFRLAVSF
jgi:hypothetical protein